MAPDQITRCVHCRERIEFINFALGPEWRHWPTPHGNYRTNEKYRHCRGSVAEPEQDSRHTRL
jgi:hypothetical protein